MAPGFFSCMWKPVSLRIVFLFVGITIILCVTIISNKHNIQHYTTLYNIVQHYTTLYNIIQHYTTLYNIIPPARISSFHLGTQLLSRFSQEVVLLNWIHFKVADGTFSNWILGGSAASAMTPLSPELHEWKVWAGISEWKVNGVRCSVKKYDSLVVVVSFDLHSPSK